MSRLQTQMVCPRRPQAITVGQPARPLRHPLLVQSILPISSHPAIPRYSPYLPCLPRMGCCNISTWTPQVNPLSSQRATLSIPRSSKAKARRRQIETMIFPVVMPRTAIWARQALSATVVWSVTKLLVQLLPKGLQRDPAVQLLVTEVRIKMNRALRQGTKAPTSPLPPPCLIVVRDMPRSISLSATIAL